MPKTRQLKATFSRGEVSPQIEGRPDLVAFHNGCSILENFWIFYEGGVFRRYGTAFIKETKDSAKASILIPFKFNIQHAYFIEAGDLYFRLYRRGLSAINRLQQIETTPGTALELVTPYTEADLPEMQWAQSADVLFLVDGVHQQRKLSRVSDLVWSLSPHVANPPPSYEADTNLGGDIAFAANSGAGIAFRTQNAVMLAGDVGRAITVGVGRGTIKTVTGAKDGTVDIIDAFAQAITAGPAVLSSVTTAVTSVAHGLSGGNYVRLTSGAQSGEIRNVTAVGTADTFTIDDAFGANQVGESWERISIPAGGFEIQGSPQTTVDVDKKEPVGAVVNLVFGVDSVRVDDVGKFIRVYGGVIKLTAYTDAAHMTGEIMSVLRETDDANPAAAPINSWSLEVASWSDALGWPSTVEFHQGRLVYGGTRSQPTTFWMSASDSFDSFVVGTLASDAVANTVASRSVNIIEWLKSMKHLFIGDAENENTAKGPGVDNPIGGEEIPFVSDEGDEGSMSTMALAIQKTILFIQTYGKKVIEIAYSLNDDSFSGTNKTVFSRHIAGTSGFRQHAPVYHKEPNSLIHFPRSDGQVASLTFYRKEEVAGWARFITDGEVESLASGPDRIHKHDDLGLIVKRTIGGATKRYVELVIAPEDESTELTDRQWKEYHTDCGIDGAITAGFPVGSIMGLGHLEGKVVDVIINNSYVGQRTVSGGAVLLPDQIVEPAFYEVGLHYRSRLRTMRPTIQGQVIDGLGREWLKLFLRLKDSIGGKVNGENIDYSAAPLDANIKRSGDFQVIKQGMDLDGYVTVEQDQPYPMELLSIFGTLQVADYD